MQPVTCRVFKEERIRRERIESNRVDSPPFALVTLILFGLLMVAITGCSEEEKRPPIDPLVKRVHNASMIIMDSGLVTETVYTGDTLRDFITNYTRDTFAPDPTHVRSLSDCHPGSIVIGGRYYPFAWCRAWKGIGKPGQNVLEIMVDTGMIRLADFSNTKAP